MSVVNCNKLLTIIIPTYNRCSLLKKSLNNLLPMTKDYLEMVDVYVSDNDSTDETKDVVCHFLASYPNLKYFKQDQNIGAANNFYDATKRVKTKYVTLLSDDDLVLPTYLSTIIQILSDNLDFGLLNVNLLSVSENGRYLGTRDSLAVENHIVRYATGGDFLKQHLISPSLISSNIFLREGFVETFERINKQEYPGYEWYYALMLSVIDKSCLYYDLPLLIQRQPTGNNVRWIKKAPLYFIYGFGHMFKSLDKYASGLDIAWKNFFINDSTPPYLLQIVSQNRDFYRDKFLLLKDYSPKKSYSIQLYLYINYPTFLAKIIIRFLKKLSNVFRK
mgnify:CR=1 FL=1